MRINAVNSVRIGSQLLDFGEPLVMGILNCTPDSFAVHCSSLDRATIVADCARMVDEGANLIDVGGCSTRPGSEPVSEQEEWNRLSIALPAIREVYPNLILSLDTSHARIAQQAIEQFGVQLINDVSGLKDPEMLHVIARTRVPYILSHPGGVDTMLSNLADQLDCLHRAGVADVIVDPGLGFGKTLEQNYQALHQIGLLHQLGAPVLIGLSRKSMLYQPLGITPLDALNATTAAHMLALMNGANILRVHDVKAARETIRIWKIANRKQEYGRSI